MIKKILIRYSILGLSFIFGILLYINNKINIISSLLLFVGGYIFIKNLFDYRKIKRNIYYIKKKNNNLDINIKKEVNDRSDMLIFEFSKGEDIKCIKDKEIDSIKVECVDKEENLEIDKVTTDKIFVNEIDIIGDSNIKRYKNYEEIPGIKRVRCYKKVRRRY